MLWGMSETLKTITQNSAKFAEYENTMSKALKETEEKIHSLENYAAKVVQSAEQSQNEEKFYFMSIWNNQARHLDHIIYLT